MYAAPIYDWTYKTIWFMGKAWVVNNEQDERQISNGENGSYDCTLIEKYYPATYNNGSIIIDEGEEPIKYIWELSGTLESNTGDFRWDTVHSNEMRYAGESLYADEQNLPPEVISALHYN
jgi:hypothetical protein